MTSFIHCTISLLASIPSCVQADVLPSQRLSTRSSIALISEEFRIVLDPVDMEVVEVPSIDLALRLKSYLMGGE